MAEAATLTTKGTLPEVGPQPHIGVICFRYMGDLVLVSALLNNLRQQWPQARLTLICDDKFVAVARAMRVDDHPLLDEVIPFPRAKNGNLKLIQSWLALALALRRQKFDLLLDAVGTSTSYTLCRLARAKICVGYLKPSKKPGPYHRFARYFDKQGYDPHFLDHYLKLLEPLAIPIREPVPRLHPSPETLRQVQPKLSALGLEPGKYVAIHFGARLERRVWRMEKVARLALDLKHDGIPVLLLYGPGEEKLAGELNAIFAASGTAVPPMWNGAADFEVLLAIASQSQIFLGNDSGPMHVAAASGTRVVGLFGRTEPSRWGPRGTGANETVRPPMPCECAFTDICQPDKGETCCVWKVEVEPVRAALDRLRCLPERE